MIINFKVKNFYSIKEEQELRFDLTKKDYKDDSAFVSNCGYYLNNTIAVLGHNASGKTNILKALSFCLWFIHKSYSDISDANAPIIGVSPHKLSDSKVSCFEIIFENDKREFQYKIEMTRERVIYEFLGEKIQRGYSTIYELRRNKKEDIFEHFKLPSITQNDKDRFALRKNISLFSFLQNTGHLPKFGLNEVIKYNSNIGSLGKYILEQTEMFFILRKVIDDNTPIVNKIIQFIQKIDIGIKEIVNKDVYRTFVNKLNPNYTRREKEILFLHSNGKNNFELDFFNESNGTQRILVLLEKVFRIMDTGGILISDEIESSIHPSIVREIIKLFADKTLNKKNAQIIFSTHIPLLLDDRNKTQIYLVEKNKELSSEIYRLDEVEGIRNDDNFCNKYLAGAYGAIGNIRRI